MLGDVASGGDSCALNGEAGAVLLLGCHLVGAIRIRLLPSKRKVREISGLL